MTKERLYNYLPIQQKFSEQNVYLIESGQVKLLMLSPEGNECLLAILTAGDISSELCLFDVSERTKTAVSMTKTVVKMIPYTRFFARLRADDLLEGFVQYLAVRVADQQGMIANLVTANGRLPSPLAWKTLRSPIEGVYKHSIQRDGAYIDEYTMVKLLV